MNFLVSYIKNIYYYSRLDQKYRVMSRESLIRLSPKSLKEYREYIDLQNSKRQNPQRNTYRENQTRNELKQKNSLDKKNPNEEKPNEEKLNEEKPNEEKLNEEKSNEDFDKIKNDIKKRLKAKLEKKYNEENKKNSNNDNTENTPEQPKRLQLKRRESESGLRAWNDETDVNLNNSGNSRRGWIEQIDHRQKKKLDELFHKSEQKISVITNKSNSCFYYLSLGIKSVRKLKFLD